MNAIWTVFRKEMLDNARDRRSLGSALLFGPLFGPVLFVALINFTVSQSISSIEEPIEVPIIGAERAPNLVEFLRARGIEEAAEHGLEGFEAAAAAVREGSENVVVMLDEDFAASFRAPRAARVALVFDRSKSRAESRVQRVRGALEAYNGQLGALRLLARGVHASTMRPLVIDELDVSTPAGRAVLLLGMVTYFLLLATLMGGLYLAIDTTAGERERGSLEPLLTTPVGRGSLLAGKMLATTVYMWVSLAVTLVAFSVALGFLDLERVGMSADFAPASALLAFVILLPFAPFGAALMTLVASFTKSYKEAQTYLSLLLLAPTLPLIFASILNVQPSHALMWIPSLSQHLLITGVVRQDPLDPLMLVESFASTLLIASVIAAAAVRCYKREAILG